MKDPEQDKLRERLRRLAFAAYEDILLGDDRDLRKATADKVMEMEGFLGKNLQTQVGLNLTVPPEYFAQVFEGLRRVSGAVKLIEEEGNDGKS